MHAFLDPRNGASLTNTIDATAHSISLLQEMNNLNISMKYSFLKKYFNSRDD